MRGSAVAVLALVFVSALPHHGERGAGRFQEEAAQRPPLLVVIGRLAPRRREADGAQDATVEAAIAKAGFGALILSGWILPVAFIVISPLLVMAFLLLLSEAMNLHWPASVYTLL